MPSRLRPSSPAPSRRRPFRVLFLSVLRRFSLFFRPVRSLKTGSRALPPQHRPARVRSRSLALQFARTRSRSLARVSRVAAVTVGGGARTCALCARARTYFIAQTSEHVYRSLEYSELRSRRVYIRYTIAICNDRRRLSRCYSSAARRSPRTLADFLFVTETLSFSASLSLSLSLPFFLSRAYARA